MRRSLLALLLAAVAAAALPTSAFAAEVLDQQQTTYDGFSDNSTHCVGQTFTAGKSGHLTRVSLYVQKLTDHPIMRVEIRATTNGAPNTTILASADVPGANIGTSFGWIDFVFDAPPLIQAGTQYAITAPPLGPMGPEPNPWGFAWGGAEQTISVDPYPGGTIVGANNCDGPYGATSRDLAFQTYVNQAGVFQPDGRVRVNFSGWVGGNVYNATAVSQEQTGKASPGNWVVFRIGVQNDGLVRDRFNVAATGAAVDGYSVRYFYKTNEITDAVNAGTFLTRWRGPGERYTFEAWVKVKSTAAPASQISRLVTITSASDETSVDAVRFTARRR